MLMHFYSPDVGNPLDFQEGVLENRKLDKLMAYKIFDFSWKFSSAGRASALQAEGHRFDPYNFHQKCGYGGIGRRARLRI